MKYFLVLILSLFFVVANSQNRYKVNEAVVANIKEEVNIVSLGDPTHQESTITNYRIDLIKKLVQQRGFTIIALEGNIYELYKAHNSFSKDSNYFHYENAMYSTLNCAEMERLYDFVLDENKKGNNVRILGFDATFSGNSVASTIEKNLRDKEILPKSEIDDFVKYLKKANITNLKAVLRNNKKVKERIVRYSKSIIKNYVPKDLDDRFLIRELENIVSLYGNQQAQENQDNRRDLAMAANIGFLKEVLPNEKIILFGSSTHFLKNPNHIDSEFYPNDRITMGDELRKVYGKQYNFIAFTALSGKKSNLINEPVALPELIDNSIEQMAAKSTEEEGAIFFTKTTTPLNDNINCRFLGHEFDSLNLWEVMNGLILIEDIKPMKIKKII